MRIGYFVHDLTDPAVERRVRMLLAGGAKVVLAGFRRAAEPAPTVAGVPAYDLGRTYDARLAHRAGKAVAAAMTPRPLGRLIRGCDAVMARNLEMLAIAARARDAGAPRAPLVYECLDVHRMMLAAGVKGAAMRGLERALLGRSSLLVISSPAFVDAYFRPRQKLAVPNLLVENKVFDPTLSQARRPAARRPPPGPPWRIGWFGMIRCRRSLEILSALAARNPGLVEVVIRGRPARSEFDDFEALVRAAPGVSFGGAYRPQDLSGLYGEVHFTWAIDYFDAGLNSSWLLPNRLYEGALHGSVALALEAVETGRWVRDRSAGVTLGDPLADTEALIRAMTPERYAELAAQVTAISLSDLVAGTAECTALVRALADGASK